MKLSDLFINDSQIIEVRVSRDSVQLIYMDPWDKEFSISMGPYISVQIDAEVIGFVLHELRDLNHDGRTVEFHDDEGKRLAVQLEEDAKILIQPVKAE